MSFARKKLQREENLLEDLNDIANYIVGNQKPEDVSYNERDTLPESISYVETYPTSPSAVKDALKKVDHLQTMITAFRKKLVIMKNKNDLRNKNVGDLK